MIFYQILSTNSKRRCMEISLENLYVDTGAYRVNETPSTVLSHVFWYCTKIQSRISVEFKMGRILWSKRRVSSACLKSFKNHWQKNWTFFFSAFIWMVANQTCYQTIKKRRLTLLNHFCGWPRKCTLPIVCHSNTRAFYSHASALLRQLPESFSILIELKLQFNRFLN